MHLGDLQKWVKGWDFMAIFYSLIAAFIFAGLSVWSGAFRYARRILITHKGLRVYRRRLKQLCSNLIVIGRKQGFSLNEVFVELDIATSSLSPTPDADYQPADSFVLLGGPGAGKSTVVRKMIMDTLEREMRRVPFLVRLREYDPEESLEDVLIRTITTSRIPNAQILLAERLQLGRVLCVLDGLDEVRPHLHKKVCDQINAFYHRRFESPNHSQLLVTCRKEAYRSRPLDIPQVCEVRPLTDQQIARFADRWPLTFPEGKSPKTFLRELEGTPRILDLARSPLLLVGGLMQYTESNVGIPEQRAQYLERIAQWLLSDWATAQGHPPDAFRAGYEKLLTKLAFFMHKQETNECSTTKVIELFRAWLPMYGFKSADAEAFIDNISTKTGILVRDVPGCAIFAQFGLQEFFASKAALKELGPNGLAEVSLKPWWRETVLLSTAQERDPSTALKALFKTNPLMGAASVAECATPSLDMQQLAIDVCLKAIDGDDPGGQAPTIALLRKLHDDKEFRLCQDLEKRLSFGAGLQKRVGIILASADTANASKALLRHPYVWDTSLEGVGYLSNTFENLLVEWISRGTFDEATRAIDLVCKSLTIDRESEMVELLPKLEPQRSEKLASSLLRRFEESRRRVFDFSDESLKKITACVQYIRDPNAYLSAQTRKTPDPWRRAHSPIPVALFLASEEDEKKRAVLWKRLRNGLLWSYYRGILKLLMGSSLFAFAFFLVRTTAWNQVWLYLVFASISFMVLSFARPAGAPPWMFRVFASDRGGMAGIAFLLGLSLVLVLAQNRTLSVGEIRPLHVVAFVFACAIATYFFGRNSPFLPGDQRVNPLTRWIPILFASLLFAGAFAHDLNARIPEWISIVIPALGFASFAGLSAFIFRDWLKIRRIALEVERKSISAETGFRI